MSTLKVNAVTDASGGNTATINSMTPTADSLQGFRNRIINGDMRIDQRNAGASVTPTNAQYTLDRYQSILSAASKYSIQQVSDAPTGFVNSLRVTSSSAYVVPAGEVFQIRQSIEGTNVADLGWGTASAKTVTLSFWVRSSLTGTFGGRIQNSAADRNYPFSYTISSANTFEYKTITIAGDTTGTWLTTTGIGVQIRWSLGTGSDFLGTAGAWTASNISSVTGETKVVATNGATWYITGAQLEVGSVATPFERRDYGRELIMCQRYYEKSYSIDVAPGTNTSVGSTFINGCTNGGADIAAWVKFAVAKRAAPTMSFWTNAGSSGNWGYERSGASGDTGASATYIGTSSVLIEANNIGANYTSAIAFGHWVASIEL